MMLSMLQLMFCDSLSDRSAELSDLIAWLADPQDWDEYSEEQKADIFGKIIGMKQATDHSLKRLFKVEADALPRKLEDVGGADGLSPWCCIAPAPKFDGSFADHVQAIVAAEKR
jgi:hypothetical protein